MHRERRLDGSILRPIWLLVWFLRDLVLELRRDLLKPPLGLFGSIPIGFNALFQLRQPKLQFGHSVLACDEPERKLLSDFQCVSAIALGQIDRLFEERDDTGSSNVVRFSIEVGLQRRFRFVGHQWLQDGRGLPVQHTREVTIAQRTAVAVHARLLGVGGARPAGLADVMPRG
jgi:hypothetical protein